MCLPVCVCAREREGERGRERELLNSPLSILCLMVFFVRTAAVFSRPDFQNLQKWCLCLLTCIAKKIVTKHFDCHSKNSIKTPQNAIAIVPTSKLHIPDYTHVKWMQDEHNI